MPIKQEPGSQQYQNFNGSEKGNSVAANRAQQQLQAQYGPRAAGSINAIQDRMGQQPQVNPQNPQQSQPQPPQQGQAQAMNQAQQQMYRQQMAAATQQQQQQQQQQQRNGQTDGPGDVDVMEFDVDDDDVDDKAEFEGILMQRAPGGNLQELGRVEIDGLLHEQMAAKAKSMEGGGLMLSLKEATRHQTASGKRSRSKGKGVAAFDGGDDDDEEVDEDAINSDLDDSEDEQNDDDVDDDGGLGHIMLCMYDKVQRVKNKWSVSPPWCSTLWIV